MAYGHLVIALLMFIVCCNIQFDGKYDARFFDKPIPQNSVWRKIYPFRERETNPLLYVKWIPCVISFIILIVVLIIYIVYWIFPSLLSDFLQSKLCGGISLSYFFGSIIYFTVMID